MIRRLRLALLLILLVVTSASAQDALRHGGWGGVWLGAQYTDTAGLNDYLDRANFDPIRPWFTYLGGEAHAIIAERFVLGGRGAFAPAHSAGDGLTLDFTIGWGQFEVGYATFNDDKGILVPTAGIGGYSMSMAFTGDLWRMGLGDQAQFDPRSGEEIGDLGNEIGLTRSGVYAFLGLVYYYPFPLNEGRAFAFFIPSLLVGVNFQLYDTQWKSDEEEEATGGPDVPFHTLLFGMNLAFGGGVHAGP